MSREMLVIVTGDLRERDLHEIVKAANRLGYVGKVRVANCSSNVLQRATDVVARAVESEVRLRKGAWDAPPCC